MVVKKSSVGWIGWLTKVEKPVPAFLLIFCVFFGVAASFAIFGRGLTVTAIFLNDTFVFFDGTDRLAQGQVPHVDFSTPVGALGYYLPYLGYRIVEGYSGSVEFASIILGAFSVCITAALLWRRASTGFALLILIVVAGIIVVPIVPGWTATDYSHAMHYNRWCWGLLTSLFVLGLRPDINSLPPTITGILAAVLLVIMYFIKISYFLVGFGFLALLAVYPDQRRKEAFAVAVIVGLAICLIWLVQPALMVGYLADIALALDSSEETDRSFLDIALTNRNDLGLLFLALVGSLFSKGTGWRDYLLFGYIVSSGIAIISQNFQFVFVVTFASAFALLATNSENQNFGGKVVHLAILVAACATVFPVAKQWARTAWTFTQSTEIENFTKFDDDQFGSMFITNRNHFRKRPPQKFDYQETDVDEFLKGDLPNSNLTEIEYVAALKDAARLIEENQALGRSILTLDFTNAVPLMVDAPRVAGGYSWLHLGRNVSAENLPGGAEMFAGFDFVIIPYGSLTAQKTQELRSLFGPYLLANSELIARSDHWLLLQLR